jgi:hypothetical protein
MVTGSHCGNPVHDDQIWPADVFLSPGVLKRLIEKQESNQSKTTSYYEIIGSTIQYFRFRCALSVPIRRCDLYFSPNVASPGC